MAKFSQFNGRESQNKVSEKEVRDKYEEYKSMSQDQLNEALLSEVAKQKVNGSFDYGKLESMVNSLQGMLPASDYENIKGLLNKLK